MSNEWYGEHNGLTKEELCEENKQLRILFALIYSPHLYTDDGEFSCGAEFPSIDFKRMSVADIKRCMTKRFMQKLVKPQ